MMGAHEILGKSAKDFTGKILNKTAQYLVDGSPEVRLVVLWCGGGGGKNILECFFLVKIVP